jgi:hypothetical protein
MTIKEIAYKINDLSTSIQSSFSSIQQIRKRHGIMPRTNAPFAEFSIKRTYAFHAGGRKELQFNIGEEKEWEDGSIFRFGVAFALKRDRTLHNSKAEFTPIINRFNNFLHDHPAFFKGFKMWYYSSKKFAEYFEEVEIIEEKIFEAENFIFIGKFVPKTIAEINDEDISEIIKTFDYLMPLYERVQFETEGIEKRLARICWNDYGWVMPSGVYGKSVSPDLHEGKFGYGHEEWLLDVSKVIGNYHYGFLEPVRKHQHAFSERLFEVWLYAIHGETGKRFLIGKINKLEALNRDQSEAVLDVYKEKGWFDNMEEQIRICGANAKGFSDWKGIDLFNVRFLPGNLQLNADYIEVPEDHYLYTQTRYSFSHYKEDFSFEDDEVISFSFKENSGLPGNQKEKTPAKYIRSPKIIELNFLHYEIREKLTAHLQKIYGYKNVTPEHPTGYQDNRIDIVANDNGRLIFYEIKTYPALKTSIREAFGQLMEYAHWTNNRRSDELIIITHICATKSVKTYFKFLRETYNLKIFYQSFDSITNILSEKS